MSNPEDLRNQRSTVCQPKARVLEEDIFSCFLAPTLGFLNGKISVQGGTANLLALARVQLILNSCKGFFMPKKEVINIREKFQRIIPGESLDEYGNSVDPGTGAIILSDRQKRMAEDYRAFSVKRIKSDIPTRFGDFDRRVIELRRTLTKGGVNMTAERRPEQPVIRGGSGVEAPKLVFDGLPDVPDVLSIERYLDVIRKMAGARDPNDPSANKRNGGFH